MISLRLLLLFIFFGFSNITNGQTSEKHLDTLVKNYVKELKGKNVDTICICQNYCIGCLYMVKKGEDKCDFDGLFISTFIFWKNKGQTFMTKKDNCFDYSVIEIKNDSIWGFFFKNHDTIKKEEIKIPQYVEIKNGKEEVHYSTVDHSQHQGLKIMVGLDIIDKNIDNYYFTKEVGFNGRKNINYEYNINSHLKKLQLLIDRLVKRVTEINSLIKVRR